MHDVSCNDIQESSNEDTKTCIRVSSRIKQRWYKSHGKGCRFDITKVLSMAKASSEEFRKCWKVVQPMISDEELFCSFEKAFDVPGNLDGKLDFIKDILRRYKTMGEPVCECLTCLFFVFVCCVSPAIVLLYSPDVFDSLTAWWLKLHISLGSLDQRTLLSSHNTIRISRVKQTQAVARNDLL